MVITVLIAIAPSNLSLVSAHVMIVGLSAASSRKFSITFSARAVSLRRNESVSIPMIYEPFIVYRLGWVKSTR